jgi:hypothetical protein
MVEHFSLNPTFRLWKKIVFSTILSEKLSEYIKLMKIAMAQMLRSFENEKTFYNLLLIKNKL